MDMDDVSDEVLTCLLSMQLYDETVFPVGTDMDTFLHDLTAKSNLVLECCKTFSHKNPLRMIPFRFPKRSMPILLAMKTRWTLDSREDFVEVRASDVHGRGVFAVQDLEPGMLVTTYPVDVVFMHDERRGEVVLSPENDVTDASPYEAYRMSFGEGIGFAGNPAVHAPHRCGHLVNDALDTSFENNVQIFYLLEGVLVALMVTKPIRSGEELFLDYGPAYWVTRRTTEEGADRTPSDARG